MSELMKQAKTYGHQTLSAHNKIIRYTYCPDHQKRTSFFQGVEERGWQFRCSWNGHLFYVLPDPTAPKTAEDVAEWRKRQLQKRVDDMNRKVQ